MCPSSIYVSESPIGGGPKGSSWKIVVGNNFGVTSDGALYATAAKISGNITATSGYIGPADSDEQKKNAFSIEEITMTENGPKYLALHRHLNYNSSGDYYSLQKDSYPVVLCPYGVKSDSGLVENGSSDDRWVLLLGKVVSGMVPFGIREDGALYASKGRLGATDLNPNGLVGKDDNGNTVFEVMYDGSKTADGGVLTAGQINALT